MYQGWTAQIQKFRKNWNERSKWAGFPPSQKNLDSLASYENVQKFVFEHLRNIFLCALLAYVGYQITLRIGKLTFNETISLATGFIVVLAAALFLIANMLHGLFKIIFSIRRKIFLIPLFFFYLFYVVFTFSAFEALVKAYIEK